MVRKQVMVRMGRKRNLHALSVGTRTGAATVENSMVVPELPYNPVIALLSIYPKNTKTLILKDICTSIFIAALFTKPNYGSSPNVH